MPETQGVTRRRIVRYILLRLGVATALLVYLTALIASGALVSEIATKNFVILVVGMYAVLGLSAAGLAWSRRINLNAYAAYQVLCDTFVVTGLVYTMGGLTSPFTAIYGLTVVGAAFLAYRRGALLSAGLNITALAGLGILSASTDLQDPQVLSATVTTNALGLVLIALLGGELAQRLLTTGQELAQATERAELLAQDLSKVLETIRSGIALVGPDGRLRSCNSIALNVFPDLLDQPASQAVRGWTPGGNDVWEVRTFEDSPRSVLVTRSILQDGGALLILEDISELRAMQQKIAREERLAAVGRLAAGIAHEIRNPLTSLSGAVQLLDLSEGDQRLRSIIQREVERLNRLVGDFMNMGSPPALKLAAVELPSLIREVLTAFQADPRYSVTTSYEARPIEPLLLDGDQLKTVLWNLLLNGAQHMPRGGTVTVSAELVRDQLRLLVTDEGTGIDPDEQDRIFDPFWTRRSGGTGLGLATVERVAKDHGGEVWVHSRLGVGTTFGIWLPAVRPDGGTHA